MTIQITIGDYNELITLAEQVLSGGQWKESPGKKDLADPETTPIPAVVTELTPNPEPAAELGVEKGTDVAEQMPEVKPAVHTLDDLTRAAITLIDAGKKNDLQKLLLKYDAPALPALDKKQFEAFAEDLRVLGAKI